MTIAFPKGKLRVGLARGADDLAACQRLRHRCFFGADGLDADNYDPHCEHLMVQVADGALIATARLQVLPSGRDIGQSYAAGFHDLGGLSEMPGPMLDIGRFCIAPQTRDADVLRAAWGALTDLVDARGIRYLFGCCSFQGIDPVPYGRAFGVLHRQYLGPQDLRPLPHPGQKVIPLGAAAGDGAAAMPPLLRSYLAMGGWVGDHAIIDDEMKTMHVFTCVDVLAVPPARAKALRALAQGATLS